MSDTVTFRTITPIFRFVTSDASPFVHSGSYKDAEYSITLKQYPQGKESFDELMAFAEDATRNALTAIHISDEFSTTDYFLVVDVTQPLSDDRKVASNTSETVDIETRILTALRLHSSRGVKFEKSYDFRKPPHQFSSHSISSPGARQYRFGHLGNEASVLHADSYEPCRNTFESLLNRHWNDKETSDKLLSLALEYHRTAFTLQNVEHAFLILMIIFEALFKKDSERSASQAAGRIAKLLSEVKADRKPIQRDFYDAPTDAFSKIRNKIAHGNPALDGQIVKSKYPDLYSYVTKAIVCLIDLPAGTIGSDYYDDVTAYIDNRFLSLSEN